MKKCLIILAAVLLPAALSAQSALHQLESMAGMSIHDVNVPDPGDPVPVDPDPEKEEPQPQQSTHLKDYTPAQETTQPTPKPEPKPQTYEERQKQWRDEQWKQDQKSEADYWKNKDEERERERESYKYFLETRPRVHSTPVFSSIAERKVVFPEPVSPYDLRDFGNFKLDEKDSTYKVDYLRCSSAKWPHAFFLGRRLENGRVEWRIFEYTPIAYGAKMGYRECDYHMMYTTNFDYRNIKDVEFAGEGRVVLLKMNNGVTIVIKPNGEMICAGRNVTFPVMAEEALFIECDGKLYASNMPRFSSPILEGDHFDYYGRTVIVTHHDSEGKPYYTMSTYGGRNYDYKHHKWAKHESGSYDAYDFAAPFSNDGNYYVIKPRGKKYYQILSYSNYDNLYKGKKKYKTLEAAHAGWPKEKEYFREIFMYKPWEAAQNE